MKFTKYFMPFAALALLASCSNDNLDAPNGGVENQKKGDLYMSVNIKPLKTRAADSPYYEIGKDKENKITDALIILTRSVEGEEEVFDVYHLSGNEVDSYEAATTATFEVDREAFLNDIADNNVTEYNVYVIANPTTAMVTEYSKKQKIQDIFELAADGADYWSPNKFLMSNATAVPTEAITTTSIAAGLHIRANDPLELGEVRVERAMSRFDLPLYYESTESEEISEAWVFNTTDEKSALKNVKITFDAVALFNQATEANIFKVTAANATGYDANKTINFGVENGNNWVLTPTQTSYTLSLFDEPEEDGDVAQVGLEGLNYTLISSLNEADNAVMQKNPSADDTEYTQQGDYYIWRYAMENTNPDQISKQIKGVSTGVVFRAKMEFGSDFNAAAPAETEAGADIYAFGNVMIGDAKALYNYATSDKDEDDDSGIYEVVKVRYEAAVAEAGDDLTKAADEYTNEELAVLNEYLVDREFTIYTATNIAKNNEPDNYVYYCYYIYYNRHNDNGKATIMGNMEFATVRNNVYKLAVNTVNKLGHPGDPSGDPTPEDPEDPCEEDHLYFSVNVEVLPWVVRFNGIDF